ASTASSGSTIGCASRRRPPTRGGCERAACTVEHCILQCGRSVPLRDARRGAARPIGTCVARTTEERTPDSGGAIMDIVYLGTAPVFFAASVLLVELFDRL